MPFIVWCKLYIGHHTDSGKFDKHSLFIETSSDIVSRADFYTILRVL